MQPGIVKRGSAELPRDSRGGEQFSGDRHERQQSDEDHEDRDEPPQEPPPARACERPDGGRRPAFDLATDVLMLTTFDLDEYAFEAMRAGASGFLLKDAPAEDIVHAVYAVARGDATLAPAVTRRLVEHYAARPRPEAFTALTTLTPRELEVLRLLAAGGSNAEIGSQLALGEATVKTHIGRILDKHDVRDRVQAVIYAYESGLIEPGGSSTEREGDLQHRLE